MASVYDNKDMTGWDLSGRKDMSGLTIEGLCLSNETPNAQVLPLNLTGTTFSFCNLDNVFVPPGNTIVNCSNRFFKVQNDGQDWMLQVDAKTPVQPLNLATAIQLGLNTNLALIPKAVAVPL